MLHACVERFDVMGGRENILGWDEKWTRPISNIKEPKFLLFFFRLAYYIEAQPLTHSLMSSRVSVWLRPAPVPSLSSRYQKKKIIRLPDLLTLSLLSFCVQRCCFFCSLPPSRKQLHRRSAVRQIEPKMKSQVCLEQVQMFGLLD
jgi:hypothetical protein